MTLRFSLCSVRAWFAEIFRGSNVVERGSNVVRGRDERGWNVVRNVVRGRAERGLNVVRNVRWAGRASHVMAFEGGLNQQATNWRWRHDEREYAAAGMGRA
jgi:hypothetical protein